MRVGRPVAGAGPACTTQGRDQRQSLLQDEHERATFARGGILIIDPGTREIVESFQISAAST